MEKERLHYLLQQHLNNEAAPEEVQELTALLQADSHPELFKEAMAELLARETPAFPANKDAWQKMAKDIVAIDKAAVGNVIAIKRPVLRMYRWVAAAAVLLILGVAAYFFAIRSSVPDPGEAIPALAITDFSQDQLILHDGSPILLDKQGNGVIASFGNLTISKQDNKIVYTSTGKTKENIYHLLYTAPGSNYEIILADGSLVSLNAASSLRYPAVFSGNIRSVELAGQAWFDVQHADRLPFAIQSGQITTTVLGTAFDIKAYPGRQTMSVAVQRGKVKVEAGNKTLAILEKGQQLKLVAESSSVQHIDTSIVGAWKQGNLNYEDESLQSIVADLQRVFKDSVSIQNTSIKDLRLTARYQKKDGLHQILTMICNLSDSRLTKKNGIFIIE